MLLIDTYLDKSKIHGVGVFAKENVKKGELAFYLDRMLNRNNEEIVTGNLIKDPIDVDENTPYYKEIDKLVKKGVFKVNGRLFEPNKEVTRAMAVTAIMRFDQFVDVQKKDLDSTLFPFNLIVGVLFAF